MSDLTPKQRETFLLVTDYWFEHGRPATLRELCTALNITSLNGVVCHLRALVNKGYIERVTESDASRHAMYRPVRPEVRARITPALVQIGTTGGLASMTPTEYRAWLCEQLAELDRCLA